MPWAGTRTNALDKSVARMLRCAVLTVVHVLRGAAHAVPMRDRAIIAGKPWTPCMTRKGPAIALELCYANAELHTCDGVKVCRAVAVCHMRQNSAG